MEIFENRAQYLEVSPQNFEKVQRTFFFFPFFPKMDLFGFLFFCFLFLLNLPQSFLLFGCWFFLSSFLILFFVVGFEFLLPQPLFLLLPFQLPLPPHWEWRCWVGRRGLRTFRTGPRREGDQPEPGRPLEVRGTEEKTGLGESTSHLGASGQSQGGRRWQRESRRDPGWRAVS